MISRKQHETTLKRMMDVVMDAQQEGITALSTLRHVVEEWAPVFHTHWLRLIDSHGTVFYESDTTTPTIHYSLPLIFYGTPVATLFSSRCISPEDGDVRVFTAELAMALNMLQRWAETEAERRSEKIQRVLQSGLTEDNSLLLGLCGLTEPPWVIFAVAMTQGVPFQHMHQLRRFFLGRLWRYQNSFPFVGWIPNGLLAILPRNQITDPVKFWTHLTTEWEKSYPQFPIASYWTSCEQSEQLPSELARVQKIMDYAARENHQGLLNRLFDRHAAGFLVNLPRASLVQLVQDILKPILDPAHQDILMTVREYLFHHQSVDKTARTLYVHKNTVIYRIHQAENLLHHDFQNTECVAQTWLALQALSLLRLEQWSGGE